MNTSTPHLALPLIAAAQAQKHVTHNEALTALDILVQLAVLDRHRTTPPAEAAEGDRHIVGAGASGDWVGKAGWIAARQDGAWRFFAPRRGWLAFVLDDGALLAYDGAAWTDALSAVGAFQNLARLGVGTTADAANPFAAKLNSLLWTALAATDGGTGDLRAKLNKQGAANTASLLLQSAFSGRAEIGLAGDDDFRLKVSPDGTAWTTAIKVDRATGLVSFPSGAATRTGDGNLLANGAFRVNQRGYASGAPLALGAFGLDRWKASAANAAMTFAAAPGGQSVTIAGAFAQIVERGEIEPGPHVLSWAGTALGRAYNIGAAPPAYAASPLAVTLDGQADVTVEFGAGTLFRAQLEAGPVATPFERRPHGTELALCQRSFQPIQGVNFVAYQTAGSGYRVTFPLGTTMRGAPTAAFNNVSYINASGLALFTATVSQATVQVAATATGVCGFSADVWLTAEL